MKYDTFLVPIGIYQKLKEIGYDGQGLVSDRYTFFSSYKYYEPFTDEQLEILKLE